MNFKFLSVWSFMVIALGAGPLQKCDQYPGTVGGVNSGNVVSLGYLPRGKIVGVDTPPTPGNSGLISVTFFGNYYDRQVLIEWTAAEDTHTLQSNLSYAIYKTEDSLGAVTGVITTDNFAERIGQGTVGETHELFDDYARYSDTLELMYPKFTPGHTYFLNVLVLDEQNNIVSYQPRQVDVPIGHAPWPGDYNRYNALQFTDVSETSMTLSWTPGFGYNTTKEELEYLVYYSLSNNIETAAQCLINGTPVGSFTANITTKEITGLTPSTPYYMNVLIKQNDGKMNHYYMIWNTTNIDDPPIPGGEAVISDTVIGTTQVNLGWFYGLDDRTVQDNLEYLVYYSTSNNISTVTECEANGIPVGSYTPNIDTIEVTGLTANTNYYFNVLIKDGAGNKSAYNLVNDTTDIDYPPTPGGSGEIQTAAAGTTQINLSWTYSNDDVTAQADLQYLGYYSTSDNISTVDSCEANGTPIGTFAANINSAQVTNLTPNTNYYFNVVVKDVAGNMSVYNMANDTTEIDYPPTPGGSGVISSNFTGTSQVNLSWDYATDDYSPQAHLKYLVYYSNTNNIFTVSRCETNGTPVGSFTENMNSKSVNGLASGTTWYFNVVVKDIPGYKSVYQMAGFTTLITDDPPVAGNSGIIEVGTVTTSEVPLSWTKATDNASLQANLLYLVYYSTVDNLGTVADCENNGTAFGVFANDIATQTVTSLAQDTRYYFNIVVKDEGNNKTCYQTCNATTDKTSVLAIGNLHEGGIVIYLDGSGGGLVCALTDQSTSAEWGCYNTALTGCEDQTIGSGQANTTAIIAGCSTAGIAARICDDYDDGTYSDWFLPSFNEGQEIKNNRSTINNGLTANSGNTFSGDYWTSTQASWDQKGIRPDRRLDAWTIFGGPPFADKNATLKVRAVRKF